MQAKIITSKEKKLVGISTHMSLADNKTGVLWSNFGPRIQEIRNRVSSDKISLQQYIPEYFIKFNPNASFIKWAAVEVVNFDDIPKGMQTLIIPESLYAIFHYKGFSHDASVFHYIYTEWLPKSGYELANCPHFEVLGDTYKNNDSNSEEEIWIPIKKVQSN